MKGNVMVTDCCVRVADAGISRLKWSVMLRPWWVAMLRFAMSASDASTRVSQLAEFQWCRILGFTFSWLSKMCIKGCSGWLAGRNGTICKRLWVWTAAW